MYSLTFDDFQSSLGGKGCELMNMDELSRNSWTETQAKASVCGSVQGDVPSESFNLQRPGSFESLNVAKILMNTRTAEETQAMASGCGSVQGGGAKNGSGISGSHRFQKRQKTVGEMTLEDFLVRAGVVAETTESIAVSVVDISHGQGMNVEDAARNLKAVWHPPNSDPARLSSTSSVVRLLPAPVIFFPHSYSSGLGLLFSGFSAAPNPLPTQCSVLDAAICRLLRLEAIHGKRPSFAEVVKGKNVSSSIFTIKAKEYSCVVGDDWLSRSVIAKLPSFRSIESIRQKFYLEGVFDVQIRSMGGNFVVLTFPTLDDMKVMVEGPEVNWLGNFFDEFQQWSSDFAIEASRIVCKDRTNEMAFRDDDVNVDSNSLSTSIVGDSLSPSGHGDKGAQNDDGNISPFMDYGQVKGVDFNSTMDPLTYEADLEKDCCRQEQDVVSNDLQSTLEVGRRLGVDFVENDVHNIKKMIELEAKDLAKLQRSSSS
ncbi:hypothetical protein Vadar_008194 [Vaccinium darrowii]|uniref:Uncharacterized protein n=1 Tax=Vaccinium darrowii TaxID=229202 RepID=A0ACB7YTP9_9ERIC|nr:hypothetical protein Vadar_008194 [Vaccinium darrowii]